MRIPSQSLIAGVFLSSIFVFGPVAAQAACAIAIGKGEGRSQEIAELRAKRDARAKIGTTRPSNASFSDPVCYVADDFARGIATYGCEVELSFCTNPEPTVKKVSKPRYKGWKKFHGGKSVWRGHGHIKFGHHRRTETVIGCTVFNARASGRNVAQAQGSLAEALNESMLAKTGIGIESDRVTFTAPECYASGNRKHTCTQTARACP